MAMPINWKNIQKPDYSDSLGFMDRRDNLFANAFSGARKVFKAGEERVEEGERLNTDAALDEISARFSTPEALEKARDSGALEGILSKYASIDSDRTGRSDFNDMITRARTDQTAKYNYDNLRNTQESEPIKNNIFNTLHTKGAKAAREELGKFPDLYEAYKVEKTIDDYEQSELERGSQNREDARNEAQAVIKYKSAIQKAKWEPTVNEYELALSEGNWKVARDLLAKHDFPKEFELVDKLNKAIKDRETDNFDQTVTDSDRKDILSKIEWEDVTENFDQLVATGTKESFEEALQLIEANSGIHDKAGKVEALRKAQANEITETQEARVRALTADIAERNEEKRLNMDIGRKSQNAMQKDLEDQRTDLLFQQELVTQETAKIEINGQRLDLDRLNDEAYIDSLSPELFDVARAYQEEIKNLDFNNASYLQRENYLGVVGGLNLNDSEKTELINEYDETQENKGGVDVASLKTKNAELAKFSKQYAGNEYVRELLMDEPKYTVVERIREKYSGPKGLLSKLGPMNKGNFDKIIDTFIDGGIRVEDDAGNKAYIKLTEGMVKEVFSRIQRNKMWDENPVKVAETMANEGMFSEEGIEYLDYLKKKAKIQANPLPTRIAANNVHTDKTRYFNPNVAEKRRAANAVAAKLAATKAEEKTSGKGNETPTNILPSPSLSGLTKQLDTLTPLQQATGRTLNVVPNKAVEFQDRRYATQEAQERAEIRARQQAAEKALREAAAAEERANSSLYTRGRLSGGN